jgi:hypothetical protein
MISWTARSAEPGAPFSCGRHDLNATTTVRGSGRLTLGIVRKDLHRLASELDPQSLGVLCLGLRSPRLSPSRIALAHRREPDLLPDRAHALRALVELERAGLIVWTPAWRDELPETHYLLTRRGRRLGRWLVTPPSNGAAPERVHGAADGLVRD